MKVHFLLRAVAGLCFLALTAPAAMAAEKKKPLQVFVLVGQSNMQGHARLRTFEHIGMDPKTEPLLREMQKEDGTPRVCEDVWISYLSSGGEKQGKLTAGYGADEDKIGPELTFGIFMQKTVGEPILVIKAAWGGKSIHTDFRPPSAGPYRFSEAQLEQFEKQGKDVEAIKAERAKATGHYYRLTIDHVKKVLSDVGKIVPDYDSDQGYELAGFAWFQGWNDMVDRGVYPNRDKPGGYDAYSEVLAHFIRDVRKDLSAPKMPFVIGVIGVGGPVELYREGQKRYAGIHQNFRDAMAAPAELPEFKGNVAAVRTEIYWDQQLVDLKAREGKIKQRVKEMKAKDPKLGREAERAATEKFRAEEFSEREREILEKGISNLEFHYLGSAKILGQIGKGFAEAMANLRKGG